MVNELCISTLTILLVIFNMFLTIIENRILYLALYPQINSLAFLYDDVQIKKRHLLIYLWNKCLVAFKPAYLKVRFDE